MQRLPGVAAASSRCWRRRRAKLINAPLSWITDETNGITICEKLQMREEEKRTTDDILPGTSSNSEQKHANNIDNFRHFPISETGMR